jgi:guanylate kinase
MKKTEKNRVDTLRRTAQCSDGRLFIISGPSGSGKTTLLRGALDRFADMQYSVSTTTRKPRKGERDGIDYHFISKEDFEARLKTGDWAEWAEVHGHYYGTSAAFLEKTFAEGMDILLDIDVQGTAQLLTRYPESVTIFVIPRSREILKDRLESRGTDSRKEIEKRMLTSNKEMEQMDIYRHILVNDHLPAAIEKLISIIGTYRGGGTIKNDTNNEDR